MNLPAEGQIKCFCFRLETHSISLTASTQLCVCVWGGGGVWMSFERAQNLNFDKEYLFGFETLVFATLGILSMHSL